MEKFGNVILAVFGGIITLAMVAVIVGQRSATPQVIKAGSDALAKVVRAAVDPVSTASTNGNNGNNSFSTPPMKSPLDILDNFMQGGGSFGGFGSTGAW